MASGGAERLRPPEERLPLVSDLSGRFDEPVVEVPGSGHALMEDNPAAFHAALDAFFKEP